MTTQMAVAYAVVTFYLLMAVLVATAYAVLLLVLRKIDDKESRQIIEMTEATAAAAGTTVWGLAVLVGLQWPLLAVRRKQ